MDARKIFVAFNRGPPRTNKGGQQEVVNMYWSYQNEKKKTKNKLYNIYKVQLACLSFKQD